MVFKKWVLRLWNIFSKESQQTEPQQYFVWDFTNVLLHFYSTFIIIQLYFIGPSVYKKKISGALSIFLIKYWSQHTRKSYKY